MTALGVSLAAISPERADHDRELATQLGLSFPLAQDAGNVVAASYGLKYAFPDYAREAYQAIGADLADYNEVDPWTLPVPAVYLIRRDGVIHHAHVDSDYRRRMEPLDVLAKLREL